MGEQAASMEPAALVLLKYQAIEVKCLQKKIHVGRLNRKVGESGLVGDVRASHASFRISKSGSQVYLPTNAEPKEAVVMAKHSSPHHPRGSGGLTC